MKPAAAAIKRKSAASTKKPGQASPSKTSSASSQATPSMMRIRARKAKVPAAIPTTEPRRSLPTFSEISLLASSISSRTSEELFSATSKTSSLTERSSWRWGGMPGPSATLVGRVLVVDAAKDDGGEARRDDAGKRAAGGEHAAPDESFGDLVIHWARPYLSGLETVADRRHQQGLCLVEVAVGGRDHLEDPAGEELLDRPVEGHRGEVGVDVAAEDPRRLAVG